MALFVPTLGFTERGNFINNLEAKTVSTQTLYVASGSSLGNGDADRIALAGTVAYPNKLSFFTSASTAVTAAQLLDGLMAVDTNGGVTTLALPTIAAMLAALPGGTLVNDAFKVQVTTYGSAANALAFTQGGATLLTNQAAADWGLAARSERTYLVRILDPTTGDYNFI